MINSKIIIADPVELAEADSFRSVQLKIPVKIDRKSNDEMKPTTVVAQFRKSMEWLKNNKPDHYSHYRKGATMYEPIKFRAFENDVEKAAKSLIKLGVQPHDSVGIMGFNSYEWVVMNMAAIFCGAISAGIYTTNSAELCAFCIKKVNMKIVLVENEIQRKKVESCLLDKDHDILAIVQYWDLENLADATEDFINDDNTLHVKYPNTTTLFYKWDNFINLSADSTLDSLLDERISNIKPNMCCTVVFTSGTTSNPKAVMLSHDNITFVVKELSQSLHVDQYAQHTVVSYLPYSHIAANIFDIHLNYFGLTTVYFAEPDAFKGSLKTTLQIARPTIFFGVPRIYEKFNQAIAEVLLTARPIKKMLLNWALKTGHKNFKKRMEYQLNGQIEKSLIYKGFFYKIADALVLSKIRGLMGLDRCKFSYFGAAPMAGEVLEMFLKLNMLVGNVYGLSETCGPHFIVKETKYSFDTCGDEFTEKVNTIFNNVDAFDDLYISPDNDTKSNNNKSSGKVTRGKSDVSYSENRALEVNESSDKQANHVDESDQHLNKIEAVLSKKEQQNYGEIFMKGRHLFMGYCQDEEKTRDAFQDGWFRSGDVGERDDNNNVTITGRVKDIIITSGGENVAPVPIEHAIQAALPIISNVVVVGEGEKFLSVLLTLKTVINTDTLLPTNELTMEAQEWCKNHFVVEKSADEIYEKMSKSFSDAIQAGINEANSHAFTRVAQIKCWKFLESDFSITAGQLGPTMKKKNNIIIKENAEIIKSIYSN